MNHNYKLGDKVNLLCYGAGEVYKVVGVRTGKDKIEIEGDFSGGTRNVIQRDWVSAKSVKHI